MELIQPQSVNLAFPGWFGYHQPMSTLDTSTVKKMAELSRIDLTDSQIDTFSHQLGDILDFVAKLPVTTTIVEPDNWLRLDADSPRTHTPDLLPSDVIDQAGNVVVKAILDRD
mgnify:CR=1 FL=1